MMALSSKPLYTSSVAAELVGVSTHTLRLYEIEGLILPHRTPTSRRLYSDVEIAKAKNIHDMIQKKGLNFAAIRHLLSLIPCWKITDGNCINCEHLANVAFGGKPCWIGQERTNYDRSRCVKCQVYQRTIDLDEIKKTIHYP